ncbi:MAG: FecR family protein [Cytophagaceae bacterium]|jgi:ferric-dicitrate binding protein FerR (iron transport regulator)|nr:FecR family protein [Cytophagaceae bacterium]
MKPEIDILLARYFGGEATAADMVALDNWLAASAENEICFEKMTEIFQHSAPQTSVKINENKAFRQFSAYIRQAETKTTAKKGVIRTLIAVAVAAACIAAVVGWFFTDAFRPTRETVIATAGVINNTPVKMAKGIAVMPDTLTTIRYIAKDDRLNVALEGKARFDVQEADKKLTVSAKMVLVEDIGTVFSVTAYPADSRITVEVESGEVHLYTTDNTEGVFLTDGMTGIYHIYEKRFETIVARHETTPIPVIFNGATLCAVAASLSAQYGVTVTVDEAVAKRLITVSFAGDETVEEMIDIIVETLSLKSGEMQIND